MREDIFRLKSEHTCTICYNPIRTIFMGSPVGFLLFMYWLKYSNNYNDLVRNRLFYRKMHDERIKVCHACYVNKRITRRHIKQGTVTGKLPFPIKYSLTKEYINGLWEEFIEKVKNKRWFIEAYILLRPETVSLNTSIWHMFFMDIFRFFHSDDGPEFVYDLDEYDAFLI